MQTPFANIALMKLAPGAGQAGAAVQQAGSGRTGATGGFAAWLGRAAAGPGTGQTGAKGLDQGAASHAGARRGVTGRGGQAAGVRQALGELLAKAGYSQEQRQQILLLSGTDEGGLDLTTLLQAVATIPPLGAPAAAQVGEAGLASGLVAALEPQAGQVAGTLASRAAAAAAAGLVGTAQGGEDAGTETPPETQPESQPEKLAGLQAAIERLLGGRVKIAPQGADAAAGKAVADKAAALGAEGGTTQTQPAQAAQTEPVDQKAAGAVANPVPAQTSAIAEAVAVKGLDAQGPVIAQEAVQAAAQGAKAKGGGSATGRQAGREGSRGQDGAARKILGTGQAPGKVPGQGQLQAQGPAAGMERALGKFRAVEQAAAEAEAPGAVRQAGEPAAEAPREVDDLAGPVDGRLGLGERVAQAAGPERTAPAPELVSHVARQVEQAVMGGVRRGDDRLTLRLRPPELGELRLDLSMRGEQLKLVVVADNHAARETIQAALPELRGSLADQGLHLEQCSVFVRQEGSPSFFGQQLPQSPQGEAPRAIQPGEAGQPVAVPGISAGPGRIDVFC